jgi:hypothetical protein
MLHLRDDSFDGDARCTTMTDQPGAEGHHDGWRSIGELAAAIRGSIDRRRVATAALAPAATEENAPVGEVAPNRRRLTAREEASG